MHCLPYALAASRFALLLALALHPTSLAALTVTTTDDEDGTNPAACSLREALEAVNTGASFGGCTFTPGDAEILLAAGTYTFIADFEGGRPARILAPLTLLGAGSSSTVIDLSNILDSIGIDISSPGDVTLENLAIANGWACDSAPAIVYTGSAGRSLTLREVVVRDNRGYNPGGMRLSLGAGGRVAFEQVHFLRNENCGISATEGGALRCLASGAGSELVIRDSVFELNFPQDEEGLGGGILNRGCNLRLDRVTMVGNWAAGESGLPGGGGLASFTVAGITHEVQLKNVTFFDNRSILGAGGGALLADITTGSQSLWLENVTFAANRGTTGHDLFALATAVTATQVVFGSVQPFGSGCLLSQPLLSGGGNLDTDGSCGLNGLGDQTVANPGLAPALADNGGLTPTLALLPGSPAIDSGNPGVCAATDQRGVFRPQDGDENGSLLCDAGAYEVESAAFLFGDGFESGDTGAWTLTVQ